MSEKSKNTNKLELLEQLNRKGACINLAVEAINVLGIRYVEGEKDDEAFYEIKQKINKYVDDALEIVKELGGL